MPLGYIDYEQIELWIVVLESGDRAYLEARSKGEYVHGIFYEQLYKLPFFEKDKPKTKQFRLDNIDDFKLLRAKAGSHGFNYGRTAKSVAEEHEIAISEAEQMRRVYFKEHPAIAAWHDRTKYAVQGDGFLRNRFGTLRRYPILDSSIHNFKGQSSGAAILKRALIRIYNRLKLPNRVLFPMHDAFLFQFTWKHAIEVCSIMKEEMERPVPEFNGFVFKTDLSVGMNWGKKKQDNLLGQRGTSMQTLENDLNALKEDYKLSLTSSKTSEGVLEGREVRDQQSDIRQSVGVSDTYTSGDA